MLQTAASITGWCLYQEETRCSIKRAGYLRLCLRDLKCDGFAFYCFKCAHALLQRTIEGFLQHPRLLVQLVSQLFRVVITEELYFPGLARSWMPRSLTVFSSLSAAELHTSLGSCFSLRFGSSSWQLLPAHTRLCVLSTPGSFREDRRHYKEPDGAQWPENKLFK